ncbi:unnamed protein product, partial [Mesorhabditis belari]|uniref:Trans-Golgi network integral membrane protein 2 n=1 Tax=Mesorhabditis belari TaxID=2138241 RepID=A0AAF3FIC9_9BILA
MASGVRLSIFIVVTVLIGQIAADGELSKDSRLGPKKEKEENPSNVTIPTKSQSGHKTVEQNGMLISQAEKPPPKMDSIVSSKFETTKTSIIEEKTEAVSKNESKVETTTPTAQTTGVQETTMIPKPDVDVKEDELAKDGVLPPSEGNENEKDQTKIEDKEIPEYEDTGEKEKNKGEVKQPVQPVKENKYDKYDAESEDGHFFQWMLFLLILVVIGYLAVHNKRRLLALVLEGRSGRRGSISRGGNARYRRLSQNEHDVIY